MRTKLHLFSVFAFASALFFSSCERELDQAGLDSELSDQEITEIRATIGQFISEDDGPETRTTLITDSANNLQLVWAANDTIGIFPSQGGQVAFPIGDNAGSKTASFDGGGWGLKADSYYSAYYPLIGEFYLDKKKIPLVMTAQTQDGNGSFAHVGKSDYMAAVNATVSAQGGVEFRFEPLVTLLHLKLTMPKAATLTSVVLETSGAFNTEAVLNLSTGSVTSKKSSPVQVLTLKNVSLKTVTTGLVLEVYFPILPVNLTGKTVSVKVYDKDQNCYSSSLTARDYVAGTIYNISRTMTTDQTHTGLPVVVLNTPGNVDITSKEEYLENSLISVLQNGAADEFSDFTNVKGRGNSTWNAAKKPYAVKFDKKKSLLGLPDDKSWVLLANYYDPTFVRNDLVFFMGHEVSNFDWTPHFTLVDLVLNGQYKGIYQLGEKIKESKKRVNIGDDGFLLEIDQRALTESDARYFTVQHITNPVNIKEPDVEYNDADYEYIKAYVEAAEEALYSDNFTDPELGYRKYMDLDSFVEWYLITEITRCVDACELFSSCYMNLKRGGKLKMGPVWDYDLAFGNYPNAGMGQSNNNSPTGFHLKTSTKGWFPRLFEDPAFVAKVKERMGVYYENKQLFMDHVDSQAALLVGKVYEDNKLWGTIGSVGMPQSRILALYQQDISNLKTWLDTRLDWLYTNINNL